MSRPPDRPVLARCRVGCAGWSLSSKVAQAFPAEGSHLERYAQVFSCVEINSSFYRPHQPKTYARWAASVPESFRFSVKMPRTVTHQSRLRQCHDLVRDFFAEVAALESKLGCVLVQLPPSLALEADEAAAFFGLLREHTQGPIVCEPRHATWFTPQGAAILDDAGIAYVQAHPAPVAGSDEASGAGMLYARLHGAPEIYYSAYDEAFIAAVAARMREALAQGKEAWCIFDNTARGEAIPNALSLTGQLP